MARMTDASIAALKPQAARYELSDPQQRGLRIAVHPSGRRTFVVRYRYVGRPKKLTLQPGISIAQARKLAADALFQVSQGNDPAAQKAATVGAKADTVARIAEEFLTRHRDKLRSIEQYGRVLQRLILPNLGKLPIDAVKRRDIVRLLDKVEDQSGPAMAQMVLAVVRRLFAWHAARSDDFNSPIVRGMSRVKALEQARERILNDDELRAVWKATLQDNGPFGPMIRFLLLTGARRDEAAGLPRSEINGTLWTLPAARNKTKQQLERPLSAAALAVISEAPHIAGSEYVFSISGGGPFTSFTKGKADLDKNSGTSGWTLHDLRRTARSLMSRAGVDTTHAERCLGHLQPRIQRPYDKHKYIAEMALAYEKLSALLGQIVGPQPTSWRWCGRDL